MNQPFDPLVEKLFHEAADVPPEQRERFLSRQQSDPAVIEQVRALLKHSDCGPADFLAGGDGSSRSQGAESHNPQPVPGLERIGQQIGPYTLQRVLGEGGMGTVYQAEQHHPVHRTVAIKLMKLGMDTRQFIVRFESERQALALMDHPNVAKVFDAGSTDTGRPYFVMEYVPGQTINEYCDTRSLNIRQRLELFIHVCQAVEHAHRKGIIHRDIKNSNVVVMEIDGNPAPKVIDFGVAKALSQRLTDHTLVTEQGQLIGTPEYMSPEQAEYGAPDIDTRSDIYSLGVLLYELLAGVRPIASEKIRSGGYEQVQQIIRDMDPPRPSTRLSSLGQAASRIAECRRTPLPSLLRELRSELEWIPLKAIRKDREQRYRSASELADDIRNYLRGLPLIAGPESAGYRVRKFVRRHRAGVAAAAAMLLLLLGGIITTSWQAIRATRAEARATDERDNAKATLEFLTDKVLAGAKPENIPDAKVREQIVAAMITPAAASVAQEFRDRPLIEATVRGAIQGVLREVGRSELALPHAETALSIRRRMLGEDHPDTLASLNDYGRVLRMLGRMSEAAPIYQQALEGRRRVLGEDHLDTISSMNNYAMSLQALDRATEAEPLLKQTLDLRRRLLGEDHPDTITSLNNYAGVLGSLKRFAEAETFYREALERRRRVQGEDHPLAMMALNNVASVVRLQDRAAEAEPLYREALGRYRRVMGEDHPATLTSLNNYAVVLQSLHRFDEAEPHFKQVLQRRRQLLGENHPDTIWSLGVYASVLRMLERHAEAEALAGEAVARASASASLGPSHGTTKKFASEHAQSLEALGRDAEAAALRQKFDLPPSTTQPTSGTSTQPS